MKESRFTEVEINHYDDIENIFCVDAWETDDDNEEGIVVARINLKGEVKWEDETAKDDKLVMETIENFCDSHYFYGNKNIVNELMRDIDLIYREDGVTLDVINPDGITSYGVEYKEILNCECYVAGMIGNGQFKTFPINNRKETIKEVAEWLIEDIISAVGEEFCIEVINY